MTTEIKIHNNTYTINFVDNKSDFLIMDDERVHCGVTDFVTKNIYVRNDLNEQTLIYTLYHELTHAYIDSYGMLQVDWNDEIVADFVATYSIDIFKDIEKILEDIING